MMSSFENLSGYAPWALSVLALWFTVGAVRWVREAGAINRLRAFRTGGFDEPVSLHPVIDPLRCVGCGACTHACPEGKIIGLIGGKAQLLDPASCIGHGACKSACPVAAIDLVFGSSRRGVDIPIISSQFESNVPGIFIAGELGGMGLIANAIEQGRQAITSVSKLDGLGRRDRFDVIVVGGGPAGIAATLAAKEAGLKSLTLEQDTLGGTVARYPRGKLVMTRAAHLPLYGKVRFRRVRKERLLALWQSVIRKTGVKIHHRVRVEKVVPAGDGFVVDTSAGVVSSRAVVLATGRRGLPRRLNVPGEELSKVCYELGEASQFTGRHVLVVGGGDSALEAVARLAAGPVRSITLVVRSQKLSSAKATLLQNLEKLERSRRVIVAYSTVVESIGSDHVVLVSGCDRTTLTNDAVVICVGGDVPMALLTNAGIVVRTHYGTAMV